jgi:hypothetical protein
MNPGDYINSMMERSRRSKDSEDFKTLERESLSSMEDKALAAWQAEFTADQPQFRLAEHEWSRRIADRQIAASHATARRAALWGAISGISGALAGVFLAWILSGQQPPTIQRRQNVQPQNSAQPTAQQSQQQPVAALPQPETPASPAPVQKPTTPKP